MIRTYTDSGMTVLDNTAGSGTTAVAAENAWRRWICIERDPGYAEKARQRIREHVSKNDGTDLL
jgi:site-specific DNA-methyltransferase (adenine-specific)